MNNIGYNIRRIRGLRGLKQAYMAHALNISVNSYGKIERNEVNIKISRLEDIASVLRTTVQHILLFEEQDFLRK